MRSIRRRLGVWSVIWLSCQVASLSAFAGLDCCPEHRALAEGLEDCHKAATSDQCPMHGADGQACPMHRGNRTTTSEEDRSCAMRGTCNASAMALASFFSTPGVLADTSSVRVSDRVSLLTPASDQSQSASTSLDTPPPRL